MYLDRSIEELHQLLVEKKVTPLDLTLEAIKLAKEDSNNAFETIVEEEAIAFAKTLTEPEIDNVFWGIPYVAKDNFSTKGILTTGSSNILHNYIPVYDATVITKLKKAKAVLIGKVTLDELAMGGTGTTGHKGVTYNPYDPTHTYMVGGSSCGSAAAVAAGIVPFSLGSDTGDSVRKPACYSGLVGFKPTWGRISRYGLFPFAPSLDHVGYFTRNVKDSAYILNLLAGRDDKDATSSLRENVDYAAHINSNVEGKRICVINQILDSVSSIEIKQAFNATVEALREKGAIIDYVDFDINILNAIYPTYIVLSCAEATSNNANLDGIKFGLREGGESSYSEVMMNARTKGFCELIKRRFVIGSYSLFKDNQKELFLRAQKARAKIVKEFNKLLEAYDAIYLPGTSNVKCPIEGQDLNKLSSTYLIVENYMAFANFAGLPSLTLPIGLVDNFPIGANITTKAFDEETAFNVASCIESITNLKDLSVTKVVK